MDVHPRGTTYIIEEMLHNRLIYESASEDVLFVKCIDEVQERAEELEQTQGSCHSYCSCVLHCWQVKQLDASLKAKGKTSTLFDPATYFRYVLLKMYVFLEEWQSDLRTSHPSFDKEL